MKNENWISRIQNIESNPPAGSWDKIQSKRKLKTRQQWSAAIVAGTIVVGGILWLSTSTQNIGHDLSAEQSITSNPKVKSNVEVAQPLENNPTSNISVQPTDEITSEKIESTTEKTQTIAPKNLSGFPYNGKVNTTSESIPDIAHPHIEIATEIVSSDLSESNSINPVELENTSEEMLSSYDIDWSKVPNLFTPNLDGQNDLFTPFEEIPDWSGKSWRISYEGNIIQTFNAFEKWDGNNAAGFEMPVGQYVVEAFYIDKPQSIQVLKKIMVIQLVR